MLLMCFRELGLSHAWVTAVLGCRPYLAILAQAGFKQEKDIQRDSGTKKRAKASCALSETGPEIVGHT